MLTWLNRSSRPEAVKARVLLDKWLARHPEGTDKEELRGRLRSSDYENFRSGFFELFLHELFLKLNCQVEVHPLMPQTNNKPDFLITEESGNQYYVEAVAVSYKPSAQRRAEKLLDTFVDYVIENLKDERFQVLLSVQGDLATAPPAKRTVRQLARWLASLDPGEVERAITAAGPQDMLCAMPEHTVTHGKWAASFRACPLSEENRNRGLGGLRGWNTGVRGVDQITPVETALKKKASRYGIFDRPFVVAIDAVDVHKHSIEQALFGEIRIGIPVGPDFASGEAHPIRDPQGVWTSWSGPRRKVLSAILVASGLHPCRIAEAECCLYLNPWADIPLESVLNRLPRIVVEHNRMKQLDGSSLSDLMGVAAILSKEE